MFVVPKTLIVNVVLLISKIVKKAKIPPKYNPIFLKKLPTRNPILYVFKIVVL